MTEARIWSADLPTGNAWTRRYVLNKGFDDRLELLDRVMIASLDLLLAEWASQRWT